MGKEIERKFLVKGSDWKNSVQGVRYRQGYLSLDPHRTVRVRISGETGYLTVKGKNTGIVRSEFEYVIPSADASYIMENLCIQPLIEKYRYRIEHLGIVWEVDEFLGQNRGLVIAEIELEHEDQPFSIPEWVDREVSGDSRYFNASLVLKPWNTWKD